MNELLSQRSNQLKLNTVSDHLLADGLAHLAQENCPGVLLLKIEQDLLLELIYEWQLRIQILVEVA